MGRRKMGETRRKQILQGMLKAVAEIGLQRCNMTDIARFSGVSRGILHYYFKNKDEIIGALITEVRDSNFLDFVTKVGPISDPQEQLRASLWYPVNTFAETGVSLAKVWVEFWGLSTHHPEAHRFILELQRSLRGHFRGLIEAGIGSGQFRPDLQAEQLASLILAVLEGLVLQWCIDSSTITFINELKVFEGMLLQTLRADSIPLNP